MVLVEHAADLWSAEHYFGWQAGFVEIPVRMTVIRLADGRLILHSPIPITPALREDIHALGTVGFIVVPEAHGKYAEEAAREFSDAQLLMALRPPRQQKSLPFHDATLAEAPPPAWEGQVDTQLVGGFRLNEVLLYHRPSRTLVLTDLCFHIQRSSSRVARAFFRANGMWQRFGPSRIIRRLAVSNRNVFHASLVRALEWDIDRIIPGHGDVIEKADASKILTSWGF